jgi:hypothetical protein
MYTSVVHRSGWYFRWTDLSCTHITAAIIPPLILYLCIDMHIIIIITTSSLNSSSTRPCPPSPHPRSVVFSPISLLSPRSNRRLYPLRSSVSTPPAILRIYSRQHSCNVILSNIYTVKVTTHLFSAASVLISNFQLNLKTATHLFSATIV